MKKSAKNASTDNRQQKISSFFQNGTSIKTNGLFSTVGKSTKGNKHTQNQGEIMKYFSTSFIPSAVRPSLDAAKNVKDGSENFISAPTLSVVNNYSHADEKSYKLHDNNKLMIIPESQSCLSENGSLVGINEKDIFPLQTLANNVKGKNSKENVEKFQTLARFSARSKGSSLSRSETSTAQDQSQNVPPLDVIPGTPHAVQQKKFSRNFLRSVSSLTLFPEFKQKDAKINSQKRPTQKKKRFPVSINFSANVADDSKLKDVPSNNQKLWEDKQKKIALTPVKKIESRRVKRLAQSGLSPASKKLNLDEDLELGDNSNFDITNHDHLEPVNHNVDISLCHNVTKTDCSSPHSFPANHHTGTDLMQINVPITDKCKEKGSLQTDTICNLTKTNLVCEHSKKLSSLDLEDAVVMKESEDKENVKNKSEKSDKEVSRKKKIPLNKKVGAKMYNYQMTLSKDSQQVYRKGFQSVGMDYLHTEILGEIHSKTKAECPRPKNSIIQNKNLKNEQTFHESNISFPRNKNLKKDEMKSFSLDELNKSDDGLFSNGFCERDFTFSLDDCSTIVRGNGNYEVQSGDVAMDSTSHSFKDELDVKKNKSDVQSDEFFDKKLNKDQKTDIEDSFELSLLSESQDLCAEFTSFSPFKKKRRQTVSKLEYEALSTGFNRFEITEVQRDRAEVKLTLMADRKEACCILHGFWYNTFVEKGDIVNVLGVDFDDTATGHVTDDSGLLIVNPDVLVSGTSVVSTLHCMRKATLNEKFMGCETQNAYMLYGRVVHCLFQEALKKKLHNKEQISKLAHAILQRNNFLHDMYLHDINEQTVMKEIQKYIPNIVSWTQKYMKTGSHKDTLCSDELIVTDIHDIEENIWSPRFGIKGKIDLTVEVKIHKKGKVKEKIVPLELKTGKVSFSAEHKGQVTLYSMMTSDRRADPEGGLLLYIKDLNMTSLPAVHKNKTGLIQLRNELVYYLEKTLKISKDAAGSKLGNLPAPINNRQLCSKCPQLLNCTAYQRCIEMSVPRSGHAMETLLPDTLAHLLPNHLDYFTRWCLMLELEKHRAKRNVKDIWCSTGLEREKKGECISSLVLCKTLCVDSENSKYINIFKRHPDFQFHKLRLDEIGLSVQDSVMVSVENKQLVAVSLGFIHSISLETVEVFSDRDLGKTVDANSSVFRIDIHNSYNTWSTSYSNLSRLMVDGPHACQLRKLIIDKKKPEFSSTLSKSSIEKVKGIFKSLNKVQKAAILKVLMSKDYMLIQGYPGTGKTSTIVALVKILVAMQQSVLLACYTHSAIDNILLKLYKENVDFLRLGKKERIHSKILPFCAEVLTKKASRVVELKNILESKKVVATTCVGTNHPIFSQRAFDICIIDEASQVIQPNCLGPLFLAKKFVLVGDSKQLPPVVQSKQAREMGMDSSLFSLLQDSGAMVELNLQYRMNSTIMELSNTLVYDGYLRCGSEDISKHTLMLPGWRKLQQVHPVSSWVRDALTPDLQKAAVFLNTSQIPAPESIDATKQMKNEVEAQLASSLTQVLLQAGMAADEIGIIAPYRNQVKVVRCKLAQAGVHRVEVSTVDQFQGRDKEVIIVTFVRSGSLHTNKQGGEILRDMRRLNVVLTRAKHKLILIGDAITLCQFEPVQQVVAMMRRNEQISFLQSAFYSGETTSSCIQK